MVEAHAFVQPAARGTQIVDRHPALLDGQANKKLAVLLQESQMLTRVHEYRDRLRQLWEGRQASNERLIDSLREWCSEAEASGIKALEEFARVFQATACDRPFAGVASNSRVDYLIFDSLYATCLRTTGSNFLVSSLSGCSACSWSSRKNDRCPPMKPV